MFGFLVFASVLFSWKDQVIFWKDAGGTFYDKIRLFSSSNFTGTKCNILELTFRL